jgi:uncharacterized protein Yka (UPF0111/DUF47 family)
MPICTYMFKDEFNAIYNGMDRDMRELCDEIEKITGERYAVKCNTIKMLKGIWPFKRLDQKEFCTVITPVYDGEVQLINLMSGLAYSRNEAGAFLIGVRAEAWRNHKK